MTTKQQPIQIRSNYRNPAHAQAMIAIAACLNSKTQRPSINEEPPTDPLATTTATERTAYLRNKLLTQNQQLALESIKLHMQEIQTTVQLINQQTMVYELNLPKLELFELGSFHGEVDNLIAESVIAAEKTGAEIILDRLTKQREINQIKEKLNAQGA